MQDFEKHAPNEDQVKRFMLLIMNAISLDIFPLVVKNKRTGKDDLLICIHEHLPGGHTAIIPLGKLFDASPELRDEYEVPEGAKLEDTPLETDSLGRIIVPNKFDPKNN